MQRALRYCSGRVGCPNLVTFGKCQTCEAEQRRGYNSHHLHALYRTQRWQRLRLQKMQENPFCVDCEGEGLKNPWDDLDHRIPHGGNLALFWDPTNLEGRCKRHHAAKTRRGQ